MQKKLQKVVLGDLGEDFSQPSWRVSCFCGTICDECVAMACSRKVHYRFRHLLNLEDVKVSMASLSRGPPLHPESLWEKVVGSAFWPVVGSLHLSTLVMNCMAVMVSSASSTKSSRILVWSYLSWTMVLCMSRNLIFQSMMSIKLIFKSKWRSSLSWPTSSNHRASITARVSSAEKVLKSLSSSRVLVLKCKYLFAQIVNEGC